LEFGLDYFVNENLRLTFGGSLSKSELLEDVPPGIDPGTGEPVYTGRKGDRLPGSAEESFSFMVDWKHPLGNGMNLFANGMYRYVGDRLNDFNLDLDVALPSYSLVDMRFGISHRSGWSAAVFADNVLDERIEYRILRTGMDFNIVPTNRPRTVGVNFIYNF
jgi:outer membrane receptor protein involved in Fe transport